jgi:hypothetical protein
VFATSTALYARAAQTQPQSCQVLKLILGPLHLDLLGLVVDLYGKTTNDPVIVTINAIPSQGLLGHSYAESPAAAASTASPDSRACSTASA